MRRRQNRETPGADERKDDERDERKPPARFRGRIKPKFDPCSAGGGPERSPPITRAMIVPMRLARRASPMRSAWFHPARSDTLTRTQREVVDRREITGPRGRSDLVAVPLASGPLLRGHQRVDGE